MPIDATLGGSSSNSYVTLEEATAYFLSTLDKGLWALASEDNQKYALMQATREIDQYFEWIGLINSDEQALAWPRKTDEHTGMEVDNSDIGIGYQLDKNPCDGTIPNDIKIATYELAYILITGGYNLSESNIDELKVGPIEIKFSKIVRETGFPKVVIEKLKRIGRFIVSDSGSAKNIRLIRA